ERAPGAACPTAGSRFLRPDGGRCRRPGQYSLVTEGGTTGRTLTGDRRAAPGPPRPRDLTDLAVSGQPEAIESLLKQVRPMVVRYCRARLRRIAGHHHVADDVAQEVCIAVLAAL